MLNKIISYITEKFTEYNTFYLAIDKFCLCLSFKLRIRQLNAYNGCESFSDIIAWY